jgi:hypothetical protein
VVSVTPRWRFSPRERTSGTHYTGGRVGPTAGLDTEDRGKILSPLPGIEPRSPGRPARSQTLYWLSYPAHQHTEHDMENGLFHQDVEVLFNLWLCRVWSSVIISASEMNDSRGQRGILQGMCLTASGQFSHSLWSRELDVDGLLFHPQRLNISFCQR